MLQSLPDSTFDTTYLRAQINDHENAVALFQQELANGQDTTVKAYASQYLPVIQMHLTMADSLIVQLERP
jgi:putative membrane protein